MSNVIHWRGGWVSHTNFFLVAHLTYENHWGKGHSKIRTFGFLGHPTPHLVNNQLVLALSKIHILASVVILGHLHAKNYLNNSNFEACLLPIDVEVNRCTRVLDLYREDNLDMMGWWDISLPTNRLQADSFKGV